MANSAGRKSDSQHYSNLYIEAVRDEHVDWGNIALEYERNKHDLTDLITPHYNLIDPHIHSISISASRIDTQIDHLQEVVDKEISSHNQKQIKEIYDQCMAKETPTTRYNTTELNEYRDHYYDLIEALPDWMYRATEAAYQLKLIAQIIENVDSTDYQFE